MPNDRDPEPRDYHFRRLEPPSTRARSKEEQETSKPPRASIGGTGRLPMRVVGFIGLGGLVVGGVVGLYVGYVTYERLLDKHQREVASLRREIEEAQDARSQAVERLKSIARILGNADIDEAKIEDLAREREKKATGSQAVLDKIREVLGDPKIPDSDLPQAVAEAKNKGRGVGDRGTRVTPVPVPGRRPRQQ